MIRIFTTLGLFAVVALVVTLLDGFSIGDVHDPTALRDPVTREHLQAMARIHLIFGVASALVVVFVNSIVVTYFIGTSRWCKEVVETYSLDRRFIERSTALKHRTFPWALAAMLSVTGVISLGAAADPFMGRLDTAGWVIPHLVGAVAGIAVIGWAFFVEARRIRAHHEVITEILNEVNRIRAERGLEV